MKICALFLFLFLFLVTSSSSTVTDTNGYRCSLQFQESLNRYRLEQGNSSGFHLPLHHIHGACSPVKGAEQSLSTILEHDIARAEALTSRLAKKFPSAIVNSTETSLLSSNQANVPLKPGLSLGSGNYIVNIGLGTPSKPYSLVVDTGSSFTWAQCEPCKIFCHPQVGPRFNPKASSTYKFVTCSDPVCSSLLSATLNPASCTSSKICVYDASYGDASYSIGYVSRDTLTISPSQTLPGFVYGCGQDNQGLFGRTSGLLGLSRHRLSMLSQLSSKYGNQFSYCLPTPSSTGYLSIGKTSYNPSSYIFTKLYTNPNDLSLYFVRLIGISVAGKSLTVSALEFTRRPTIIDSGTVITRLPATIYTALKQQILASIPKYTRAPAYSLLDTCFKGSNAAISVPEVRFLFEGGTSLKLEPLNVLIDVNNGAYTCLAFAPNSGLTIIGNRQQQKFSVVYDVANSRLGFAAGGCS